MLLIACQHGAGARALHRPEVHPELIAPGAGMRHSPQAIAIETRRGGRSTGKRGQSMPSLKSSMVDTAGDLRTSGLARPAAEKFAGAWLACFLVMARGNIFAAFTLEHAQLASVCGL